jgi:hypothetical protein
MCARGIQIKEGMKILNGKFLNEWQRKQNEKQSLEF